MSDLRAVQQARYDALDTLRDAKVAPQYAAFRSEDPLPPKATAPLNKENSPDLSLLLGVP